MGKLIFVAVLAAGIYWLWPRPVRYPAVYIKEDPVQVDVKQGKTWDLKDHHLTELATYHVKALVLGAERYRNDRFGEISPVDFALGWGPMSDYRALNEMTITQSGRWYGYQYSPQQNPPPPDQISSHSANTHMIPIDAAIEKKLLSVRAGDVIEADGYLVEVKGKDGFSSRSSLTRTDTDGGACEVMLVENIEIIKLPPAPAIAHK